MTTEDRVAFRGGIWAGVVPLGVFLAITIALVIAGAPTTEGMIVAAMTGISIGMVFAHSYAVYSERVFSLMANRVAAVAIVCWMWAGAFSGILAASGLVEAIVWVGWKLGLEGAAFTVIVFLSAAAFAVFVGTGLGTIVGFTAVMYPAGVLLGAEPAALMGAILSGAAFGDNLAPISDTTIVSAATQETDVPGVVKSRLKYVLIAGAIAALAFFIVGSSNATVQTDENFALLEETADPKGLPMLIPPLLVFVVAVSGFHFLAALTAGIVAAIVIGPVFGIFSLSEIVRVSTTDAGDSIVEGAFVGGAMGLVPIGILTLLLVTSIGLMGESGFLNAMMEWLEKRVAKTVRGAEAVIVAMISFANCCVSVNTVAMITTGPLANELRKRHNIHPYRCANLLDTISCSFPYLLPYAAVIPAAVAMEQTVAQQYAFAPVIGWAGIASHGFYQLALFPIMLLAVATGYGRRRG